MTTNEQRNNLLQLALYVWNLPDDYDRFCMFAFWDEPLGLRETPYLYNHSTVVKPACGTTACFAGHGPAAGVRLSENDQDWHRYIRRVFGLESLSDDWDWLFASDWQEFDNTTKGAAKRAFYFLKYGIPKGFQGGIDFDFAHAYGHYVECYANETPDGLHFILP